MRALGRVVRDDEAANEVVAAGGLAPVIALLSCNDAAVVRRYAMLSSHLKLSESLPTSIRKSCFPEVLTSFITM